MTTWTDWKGKTVNLAVPLESSRRLLKGGKMPRDETKAVAMNGGGKQIWNVHTRSHVSVMSSTAACFPLVQDSVQGLHLYVIMCRVSLPTPSAAISHNPLAFSQSLMTLTFWKAQVSYFIVLVCLMFPCDLIQIVHVQMEYQPHQQCGVPLKATSGGHMMWPPAPHWLC